MYELESLDSISLGKDVRNGILGGRNALSRDIEAEGCSEFREGNNQERYLRTKSHHNKDIKVFLSIGGAIKVYLVILLGRFIFIHI